MSQSGFAYQIELIHLPSIRQDLTIRFVKDGKVICSWRGHKYSVFVQKDNILTYALFSFEGQGCTIVAVDLTNGNELWRTELKAIKKAAHSGYGNLINMHALDDVLVIHGQEDFGNYAEIVDFKTGETFAHREYPVEKERRDDKQN